MPGADDDHELRNKAAESGQAHAGHAGDDEGDGGKGNRFVQVHRAEQRQLAGVGAGVDHAADHSEQQPGENAVGEHLDDRAGEADLIERHQAEQDEAHVADAGVADDEFEVLLHQRDHRAVDDADDGEHGEDIAPGAEAEHVEAPGSEAEREQRHGDAQAAVGAQLHHDAGEQHGSGRGRGDVAGRRPGVEGPQAGENREADEDQREGPHLEVRGEGKSGEVAKRHGFCAGDDVGGDQADRAPWRCR